MAAFVAVADVGTISGAAQQLHISASALSANLTELERALNAQLLTRHRAKGVQLTPTGELLVPRARLLLHQGLELEADARGERGAAGVVRLGCYPSLAPTLLPPLITGFAATQPETQLEVTEANQDQLTASLEGGLLDAAIMYDLDLGPSWRRAGLALLKPLVVLPGDHRLAASEDPVDLNDLRGDPLVLLDAPPSSAHALGCCAIAGFAPRIGYRARTYETARSFVGRGLGWTILLQRPSADVTYEGLPVAVREIATPGIEPVSVDVVWHPDSLLNRATRAFLTEAVRLAARQLKSGTIRNAASTEIPR
nr:LysR substrate-binding domain-containing protein [Nocardioides sp. zg-DK7169]